MPKLKNINIPTYQVFKYTIYLLLSYNIYLFFVDDLANSSIMFSKGINFKDIIVGFSGSIDTAAWVMLLLIFELETYVIDDHKLRGGLKWLLNMISILCYVVIIYSYYGYLKKYFWFFDFQTLSNVTSTCNYIDHSWLKGFDEYAIITTENCANLAHDTQLFILPKEEIITNSEALKSAKRVALIDVFNASAWLLVVIVLEIDVWLKLKNKLVGVIKKISDFVKIIAYIILIIAAISWGISGIILDTWDAILWILAFIFIEMNMFKWQNELDEEKNVNKTFKE